MEGLIAKFIVVFLWGVLIGGIPGFLFGAMLASAKFRDIAVGSRAKEGGDPNGED